MNNILRTIALLTLTSATLFAQQKPVRELITSFGEDRDAFYRFYSEGSPDGYKRFEKLYSDWLATLQSVPFDKISNDDQVDWILFNNHLNSEFDHLKQDIKRTEDMRSLIPFSDELLALEDNRRKLTAIQPESTAAKFNRIRKQVSALHKQAEADAAGKKTKVKPTVANRASKRIRSIRRTLSDWYGYYEGYDPVTTWWLEQPWKSLDKELESYATFLENTIAGVKDSTVIIGDPIGREALLNELRYEMIPYTPDELVAIANKEFAWCEREMKKASQELGYGDDWKAALEHVKQLHVAPGDQPALIRDLAWQATEFVEKNNLVTVPPVAKETWRMEMMSPERQLFSPFFLGGEQITVSYPTNTMSHEQKMMSMRGNNKHFSHATVHHELIPGHHLQMFMMSRHNPHRRMFYTPFWVEGWALYWEFLLWDKGFHATPEDRVGALFWRMHRCARIIFSLSFHLETMTPQQSVDFLVERVGHERDNAMAEVRRSFAGDYPPLYQIAYMIGGLQFYRLHKDLVDSGKMTDVQFHDTILQNNSIPVEIVRAILTKQTLTRNFEVKWKFYE